MTNEERFAQDLIRRSLKVKVSVFAERKKKLFSEIAGTVLEIGAGAGVNLQYFPKNIQWIGVEPNEGFHAYLKTFLSENGFQNAEVLKGGAEQLPVPDASVDAVVSTQVLCSVPDVAKALAEVQRVLKLGGTFYFLEHVAAPRGTLLRLWQNLTNPWQKWRGCGCNVNRETLAFIQESRLKNIASESFTIGRFFPEPTIIGTAQK